MIPSGLDPSSSMAVLCSLRLPSHPTLSADTLSTRTFLVDGRQLLPSLPSHHTLSADTLLDSVLPRRWSSTAPFAAFPSYALRLYYILLNPTIILHYFNFILYLHSKRKRKIINAYSFGAHCLTSGFCWSLYFVHFFFGGGAMNGVMSDGYRSVLVHKLSAQLLHI